MSTTHKPAHPASTGDDLRQKAEKIFRKKRDLPSEDPGKLPPDETRRILHELQVHQIELELQNEELRRVQLELEATRTRYFDLYELAPVGYCTISSKGQILEANLTAATLLEADKSLLAKRPLTAFIAPDDQTTCYLQLKNLFDTGQPQSFELRTARKDGPFWLQLTANLAQDQSGEPLCRLTLHDISRLKQAEEELRASSDRKMAEEALRESEERYRQLFESASDAIFLISPDNCQIIDANKKASELYGYTHEELLTKTSMDISAEPEQTYQRTLETQTIHDHDIRLHRKKDGTVLPVEITAQAVVLKEKPAMLVAVRDTTERRQAEEEKTKLEALNWQLQKRESLRRMAGAIAHHFNNRLGVVIGNLEMAIDDLPRGVGPAYSLATALQAAKKAAEVSGLLLTYLGQTTGRCEPLDLAETCRSTLPLLLAATPKTINF
ncbi:MAG: PAS domain S-box protein, partial [Desulfobulbaceae bacterium]